MAGAGFGAEQEGGRFGGGGGGQGGILRDSGIQKQIGVLGKLHTTPFPRTICLVQGLDLAGEMPTGNDVLGRGTWVEGVEACGSNVLQVDQGRTSSARKHGPKKLHLKWPRFDLRRKGSFEFISQGMVLLVAMEISVGRIFRAGPRRCQSESSF